MANTIIGNAGDNLLNGAWGNDTLIGLGGTGDDTYYVDNAGDVIVEMAGEGSDLVYSVVSFALRNHSQALETLTGTANLNETGNGLANTIIGNAGDNVLNGAWGDDTLTGLGGDDTFVFSNGLTSGVDTIQDFVIGEDTLQISAASLAGIGAGPLAASAFHIGASASSSTHRIIYDATTGALSYDSDGIAGAPAILFAQLSSALALAETDFLIV